MKKIAEDYAFIFIIACTAFSAIAIGELIGHILFCVLWLGEPW